MNLFLLMAFVPAEPSGLLILQRSGDKSRKNTGGFTAFSGPNNRII
jgi:hypothetical protein